MNSKEHKKEETCLFPENHHNDCRCKVKPQKEECCNKCSDVSQTYKMPCLDNNCKCHSSPLSTLKEEFYKRFYLKDEESRMGSIEAVTIADWWLQRFSSYKESLREEIEKKKKENLPDDEDYEYEMGFNSGLDVALSLISEKEV